MDRFVALRCTFSIRLLNASVALLTVLSAQAVAGPAAPQDYVVKQPGHKATVATARQPDADPSVIDVGFFYARELLQRGLSLTSLDETARKMVLFTNDIMTASGVDASLRITYAGVFEHDLVGINTRSAHSLLGQHAHNVRDGLLSDYGVDAVILLKATDDVDEFFGVASLGSEPSLSDKLTVPYAVVCLGAAQSSGLECFGQGGIFAHEVGHLFGAGHQRNAPGGTGGAFEFSYASECGGGTTVFSPVSDGARIYSTPNVSADGQPCGVAASAGPDGTDNAHTLNLTRGLMADLRSTMPVYGSVMIDSDLDYAVTEGDQPILLQLRRDGDLTQRTRVNLDVVSRKQTNDDIVIDPREVIFEPGQDVVAVQIRVIDDVIVEPAETIEIGMRNPWQLDVVPATKLSVTIADNDVAPAPPPAPPPPTSDSGGGGISLLLVIVLLCIAATRTR